MSLQSALWQPSGFVTKEREGLIFEHLHAHSLYSQHTFFFAPSIILLLYAPFRLHQLLQQNRKVTSRPLRYVKLVFTLILVSLNTVAVIRSLSHRTASTTFIVAILNFAASIAIVPLSYLEDERKLRPSSSLILYFTISLLLDFSHVWNLRTQTNPQKPVAEYVPLICTKIILCGLENSSKERHFKQGYQDIPPEAYKGLINRTFFWWLKDLFVKATSRRITPDDLFELDEELKSKTLSAMMQGSWDTRSRPERRISFILSLFRCFRSELGRIILPRLCLIGFTFAQPFLITAVLELLYQADDEENRLQSYQLIAMTMTVYSGIAITSLHSNHSLFRFITMFRGATVSLIYGKSLQKSKELIETAAAISLMSNDVDRISFCLEELNECWARLIELGIGISLLTKQLGWVSVVPLIVVIVSSVGSSGIAKLIGDRQAQWASATQRRLTKTKSVLSEIRGIKIMGLEEKVQTMLQEERIEETKKMERFAWVMVWVNVVANIPFALAPAATFAVFALEAYLRGSDSLDTVKAFTSLALVHLVAYPASRLLSAVPQVAASLGCFDRIQDFLVQSEQATPESTKPSSARSCAGTEYQENDEAGEETALLANGTVHGFTAWEVRDSEVVVMAKHANITLSTGRVVVNDLTLSVLRGSMVCVTGSVGTGKSTLLKAILGEVPPTTGIIKLGDSLKGIGYCAQVPWIPYGTIKEVICGVSFNNRDGADDEWYNNVLEACALSKDIDGFALGDATVVGSRGATLSGGQRQRIALARAVFHRPGLLLLDNVFSSLDMETQNAISGKLFGPSGLLKTLGSTIIMITYDSTNLQEADNIIILPREPGDRVEQGPYEELCTRGVLKPRTVRMPSLKERTHGGNDLKETFELEELEGPDADEVKDLERKTGDMMEYSYYFRAIGAPRFSIFILFAALNAFSGSFSSYSLGIGGYAWAIAVVIAPSTARSLHKILLDVVFRAPMSFFTSTETGAILNRFGQDMSMIEGPLSTGLLQTFTNLFTGLAEIALIATGSYYMAITIPFTLLVVYYLQHFYLQTSRQLRILELESRSPVYVHFLETLEGLETIRAFGWQSKMIRDNENRLDESQKPYYLMFCIQRWLALVLDLIIAGLATGVVTLALCLRSSTSPGLLGVSMNAVLSFNQSITQFIAGWTALETSLGAIARLRQLEVDVKPEEQDDNPSIHVLEGWPFKGRIDIHGLNASYNSTTPALRDINLSIDSGQHVAICGRTGSGKSSLLAAILRMLPETNGDLHIDGIDTSAIDLWTLRRRIISIPQDFIHLPGPVRLNLDPFNQCADSQIESSLRKVKLWDKINSAYSLDMDFDPSQFSTGEKQLLSLARAVLQREAQQTALILMDEATSSLDEQTESLIHQLLGEEFGGCTVISIAHRPASIQRADLAIWMDNGRIIRVIEPESVRHT